MTGRLGVVVSTRSGRPLLVQTRGVDHRAIAQLAHDAVHQLEQIVVASDPGDIPPHMQGPPLTCSTLHLEANRWRCHYRALGQQLLVFVLVPNPGGRLLGGSANAFSAMSVLHGVCRVLMGGHRSVDVGTERIGRKYHEIYLAIDALLTSGGSSLSALEAMEAGKQAVEGVAKAEAPASMWRGRAGPTSAPRLEYKKRTLAGQAEQLGGVAVPTDDVLEYMRPLQGWEPRSYSTQHWRRPRPRPRATGGGLGDPFGGSELSAQMQQAQLQSAYAAHLLQQQAAQQAAQRAVQQGEDPFVDVFGPIAKDKEPWEAFEGGEGGKDGKGGQAKDAKPKVAELGPVPPRPLLRLHETWRCEVLGSRVVRCGLEGAVAWAPDAAGVEPPLPVRFALRVAEGSPAALLTGVRAAQRHGMATQAAWPPGPAFGGREGTAEAALVADGMSSRVVPPPLLLRYHIAPGGAPCPLQLHASSSLQRTHDGQTAVVLGWQLLTNPDAGIGLEYDSLVVSVKTPEIFEFPARVDPPGATFDAKMNVLRWEFGREALQQQARVEVAAAFVVPMGPNACSGALRAVVAEAELRGAPGRGSLSGLGLDQDWDRSQLQEGVEDDSHWAVASWRAVILSRLSPTLHQGML